MPILFAIFVNMTFVIAAALWVFILIPALRDVWRQVRVGEAPPPADRPDPGPVPPGQSIQDRVMPPRW